MASLAGLGGSARSALAVRGGRLLPTRAPLPGARGGEAPASLALEKRGPAWPRVPSPRSMWLQPPASRVVSDEIVRLARRRPAHESSFGVPDSAAPPGAPHFRCSCTSPSLSSPPRSSS